MKLLRWLSNMSAICTFCVALLVTFGCGGATYEVAEVDGVLLINGEPGYKINIQFIPDVDRGTKGPISIADTDSNGRFTLQLMEGAGSSVRHGAVIGWHRIVLTDLQLAESETGKGVPIRLKQEYTLPGSTTLTQEVKPGKQTIEINVP